MATGEDGSVTIATGQLSARIARHGAELVELRDEAGRDLLWDGDPAFWAGHAPILFPIVGRLKDDRLTVEGTRYPMRQHGIARLSDFDLVSRDTAACLFRLTSDDDTRRVYPYDFTLDLTYRITGAALDIAAAVRNTGTRAMPASFGFHPAFRWPLPYGAGRGAHAVLFEHPEPEPIRQVMGGLLTPRPKATPVRGRDLPLDDALFAEDALIFLEPASRSLRFGPAEGRALRIDFPLMPQLGLWSKPGAGFLCIEPWCGYASPDGFDGEFADKPGLVVVEPGTEREFGMRVALEPAAT